MNVEVTRESTLTTVKLSSPPLNLFDDALIQELDAALEAVAEMGSRGVLVCASGDVVSAGVDVHVFEELGGPDDAQQLFARLLAVVHRVEALPVPTIFAAHGLCLTAAFELALGCDLVVAAESARFGLVERVVGLTPAMGGTQRLAARAGAGRAREVVMTGQLYDAATLQSWGVVNRVFADEQFRDEARDYAEHVAAGPPAAHALTKRLIRTQQEENVSAADAITAAEAALLFDTEDVRVGIGRFLEQGPPRALRSDAAMDRG